MTIPVNAGAMHTALVRTPGAAAERHKQAKVKNATAHPGVAQVIKEQANRNAPLPKQSAIIINTLYRIAVLYTSSHKLV